MEFIKTAEVIGNVAEKIFHAGQFVVKQFQGGAWTDLPPLPQGEVHRPVRANIEHYNTGEQSDV